MENTLKFLEGHYVDVDEGSDQLTLRTERGWVLAIYNRYALISIDKSRIAADAINGGVIVSVETIQEVVAISFESGATLLIDMSDGGFRGPEAMQLSGPEGEIVVWP